ncbi:translation initiation factor IF-2 [Paludibacter sp.]
MPIKLSKACSELNIGKSTIIEFLAKKGIKIVDDLNHRLADDIYLLLAKEFNKSLVAKIEAERLAQERLQKETPPAVNVETKHEIVEKSPETEVVKAEVKSSVEAKTVEAKVVEKEGIEEDTKQQEVKEETKQQEVKEEVKSQEIKEESKPQEVKEQIIEEKKVVETPLVSVIDSTIKDNIKEEFPKSDNQNNEVELAQEEKTIVEIEAVKEEKLNLEKVEETDIKSKEKTNQTEEIDEEEDNEITTKTENQIDHIEVRVEKLSGPTILRTIKLDPKPIKTKGAKPKENRNVKSADVKPSTNDNKKNNGQKGDELKINKEKKRDRITTKRVDINRYPIEPLTNKPKLTKADDKTKSPVIKRPFKPSVSAEEVDRVMKETLATMASKPNKSKGAKYRRERREAVLARQSELEIQERQQETILKLTEFVTVSELAVMMDVNVNDVIGTCMKIGMMVSINQRLDAETINIVAEEFGFTTEFVSADVVEAIGEEEPDKEEDLVPRAPIVTVMGHVDHGKTSLLDYIRKANVIAGEAGGITQHIGAYNVKLDNGQRITFLDTPGHEAFTAMRARGAKVTDIAIIIVAADDSVMPQTVEAINHASAAGVPMVFAINKVDKPTANPEKIKEALANMNYLVEDWGGKYQSQDVSAKQGLGMSQLLEKVLLEAEMLELKANPNKRAVGSVIESSLDKGRGYVATVLVQNGTLKMGDIVLAGTYYGRIKAMFNERNQRITEAKPSEPVLILGLNGAPQAGDNFNVMSSEHEARDIANKREQLQREQSIRTKKHFTLDELGRRIALGDFKELNIIVKGDVDGSVEALADSLQKLSTENIQVNIIHKAVGAISDSDILLAAASNAIICGFQVRPTASARKMAEKEEIDVRLYSIIYDAIEEIKSAMEGMLSPDIKEEITATLEIREVYRITKVGAVAGCLVREGKIKRSNKIRVIRDGIVVFTGEIDSLKRIKDDVKEVGTNFECGLKIKNYNDIYEGDMIESFEETEVKKTLS